MSQQQHNDLFAAVLLHLNRAFLSGCTQSCAVAGLLLERLAANAERDTALEAACANLSETLNEWRAMQPAERAEAAPWINA